MAVLLTPATMQALLATHGFTVVGDDDLWTLAEQQSIEVRHRPSLDEGRISVADRPADRG